MSAKTKKLKNTLFVAAAIPSIVAVLATQAGQVSATTLVQSNVCQNHTPIIDRTLQAKKVATKDLTLTGTADARVMLAIKNNGQDAGTTTANDSGVFSVAITLKDGTNVIIVEATNFCGKTIRSDPVAVTRQSGPAPKHRYHYPPSYVFATPLLFIVIFCLIYVCLDRRRLIRLLAATKRRQRASRKRAKLAAAKGRSIKQAPVKRPTARKQIKPKSKTRTRSKSRRQ